MERSKAVDKVRSNSGPILVGITNRLADQCKRKREIKLSNQPFKKCKLKPQQGNSCRGATETNPTRNHEVADLIPGFAQRVKDLALP